jgi:hypothetical protein
METALEALAEHGIPAGATDMPAAPPRRTIGKLNATCRSAAVQRARRLLSHTTPFKQQVPFADAVRVAASSMDESWIAPLMRAYLVDAPDLTGAQLEQYCQVLAQQPAAIQLQAVSIMVQSGFYFAPVKVVFADPELLKATLEEIQLITQPLEGEEQWQVALAAWAWKVG